MSGFTTMDDTRADLTSVNIFKAITCPDGTQVTLSSETQTYEQIKSGIVILLSTYERSCGTELEAGALANATVNFSVWEPS
eukprot:g12384.t1